MTTAAPITPDVFEMVSLDGEFAYPLRFSWFDIDLNVNFEVRKGIESLTGELKQAVENVQI